MTTLLLQLYFSARDENLSDMEALSGAVWQALVAVCISPACLVPAVAVFCRPFAHF